MAPLSGSRASLSTQKCTESTRPLAPRWQRMGRGGKCQWWRLEQELPLCSPPTSPDSVLVFLVSTLLIDGLACELCLLNEGGYFLETGFSRDLQPTAGGTKNPWVLQPPVAAGGHARDHCSYLGSEGSDLSPLPRQLAVPAKGTRWKHRCCCSSA